MVALTPRSAEARVAECGMTHVQIREAATATHKHCSRCGEFKVLSEFPTQRAGFLGRMAWCCVCWRGYRAEHARRPDQRERRNAYLRSTGGYRTIRLARLRALFGERGVELEQRRLDGAPCEACGGTEHVCVDHDHALSEARGLLCRRCNLLLGWVDDDAELLRRLAEYVERG